MINASQHQYKFSPSGQSDRQTTEGAGLRKCRIGKAIPWGKFIGIPKRSYEILVGDPCKHLLMQ